MRSVGRFARSLVSRPPSEAGEDAWQPPDSFTDGRYDGWLQHYYEPQLRALDAACEQGGEGSYSQFRALDDDVWALLLTGEQRAYPNIAALLPEVPEPWIQELWNGLSGAALAAQSVAFYRRLRSLQEQFSDVSLDRAHVLDFGCGWGRLTRFLARDVAPGRLFGCDPVEGIVEACRKMRVPARVELSEFVPERLPFDQSFDLAFAFSVFTHLSERAHLASLAALHDSISPGGLLVLTIRPPEYLWSSPLMHPALESLGPAYLERLEEPRYLFVAHDAEPSHPQYSGPEMTYGEAVVTLPYIQEHWVPRFELLAVELLIGDLEQVVVALRRSP